MSSAMFTQIYDTLPPEVQQTFVREHLIALLDFVPSNHAGTVIAAATRIKNHLVSMPVLDLKAKEAEINVIMEELRRKSKHSLVKGVGISPKDSEELLEEGIQSVLHWLNDIWSVVYECNVSFGVAHTCLLYSADVLSELSKPHGECNCEFKNKFISFTIKRQTGETVRCFSFTGAQHILRILLWIWRDLFLSFLASSSVPDDKQLFAMLSDIESAMGWDSLHRLLHGGTKSRYCCDDDNDDEQECDDDDYDDCCGLEETTDDTDDTCDHDWSHLRSGHWSNEIKKQTARLRLYVSDHLISTFKITPSFSLFNAILSINPDPAGTATKLLGILSSVATNSSDTFVAALNIFAVEGKLTEVTNLLNSHFHLLRPRDAPILQTVVTVLAVRPSFQLRSLQILEKELMDTAQAMSMAISASFCNISKQANKNELSRIMKLRQESTTRQDRVRQWVDTVITPETTSAHPVAIAAMMMGFPPVPDSADMSDPYGFLDLHQNDKDLEDLRDQLRPNLKDRFEGWDEVARSIKGGPNVLLKVYAKVVELMPYIRAPDAVDEMISRLVDKHEKHHICDALIALSSFSKLHVKKLRRLAAERKAQSTSSTPPKPGTSKTKSSDPIGPDLATLSSVSSPGVGGMNSVD